MTAVATWLDTRTAVQKIAVLLLANVLLIACAQIAIRVPFSPAPITGQTFGVLLVAAVLGRRYGSAVVATYVLQGAVGLPVFAEFRGLLGGPTTGYLLAMPFAAYMVGWLMERMDADKLWKVVVAMSAGALTILVGGALWLVPALGLAGAFAASLIPFLGIEALKVAVAAPMASTALKRD